jgi:TRAP-type mannitol/chloroaromatic compound transport system permease small subunit
VINKTGSISRVIAFIDRLTQLTGVSIAWLLVAMVLIQTLVVILRYGFDIGSIALQESVSYIHASCFMLGAAYTLKIDGHVRVDIFYRNFGPRGQALVNLLGSLLLLLPVCGFIFWTSLEYVQQAWSMKEQSSDTGGLPIVYLLKTLIPLLAISLILQGIAEIARNGLQLLPNRADQ